MSQDNEQATKDQVQASSMKEQADSSSPKAQPKKPLHQILAKLRKVLRFKKPVTESRWKRIRWVLINSMAWMGAIWLGLIVLGSIIFYLLEHEKAGVGLLDSFYWGMQIATTTGPGDVTPQTVQGKILFLAYNPITSVWALLILGANIVVRQVKNADIFSHREQEWLFGAIERIFGLAAWCVKAQLLLLKERGITPPPLPDKVSLDGHVEPLPQQPHDTGEDEGAGEAKTAAA